MNNYYNLTNSQKNIFEVEKSLITTNNACNVLLVSVKFELDLDFLKLEKTLNKIIEVNDSFRIKLIKDNNEIKQFITNYEYEKFETFIIDKKNEFTKLIDRYKKEPMDIYNKLYDFKLIKFNGETYILYKVHHIINDAWGMTQVAEQIKEIYPIIDNETEINKIKKASYIDIIKKGNEYNNSERYKLDKNFWNEYVKKLSVNKIFNKDISDNKANRYIVELEDDLYKDIEKYCENNKISEYTFFLAAISIYFFKIYSIQNLNIGTPFLNRNKKEFENIGLFVSNLPLNINVDENDTFINLCETIYKTNFKIFRHSKFPYTEIQKLYADINSASNIFEIGFSYQINTLKQKLYEDIGKTNWYFTQQQNNSITIHLSQMNKKLEICYDYIETLFDEQDIKKMNDILLHIISQIIEKKGIKISDINVITEKEKKKLLSFNNTGKVKLPNITISELFDKVCKDNENKIAIKYNNEIIKYKEFYCKVCNLAIELRNHGVKRNTPVMLLFDKSIEMLISLFAVIKAGGCYVPVLPQEERERIKYILNDCNPICVLTTEEYKSLAEDKNIIVVDKKSLKNTYIEITNINSNDDLIYIIYTSGSTGNPKGTKILHKNIYSLFYSMTSDENLRATNDDVSMSLLKYSFDASGIDIYSSILNGGKLILISKEDELNPEKVVRIMEQEKVTRSFLVPKWLEHINNSDYETNANLSNLKILGSGGEIFKPRIVQNLFLKYPKLKILNLYGPTETTMFSTYNVVKKENIDRNDINIGKPINYSRALILNSSGDILPTNTIGELILFEDNESIKNLSDGYLNLKEITESKFVLINNIIKEKEKIKSYRTGDMAKINNNLEIEYVGRTDDIVKINNGYLVSINEVENKINKIIGSKLQFTIVDVNTNTTKSLVLFIKSDDLELDVQTLKKHINANISFYMRIKDIIVLKDFPQNNSGKIDKKKLKKVAETKIINKEIILPRTKTEEKIYEIIKKQCELEIFSTKDDFIDDLAIDSLNMTVIYSLINDSKITMQDMYSNTTVQELAMLIDNHDNEKQGHNFKDIKIKNDVNKFNLDSVLVTGATGFLGVHILIELLKNENVRKIYCLVRNKENVGSVERLYNKINYYFKITNELEELLKLKLQVIDGDIIKENFGLNSNEYSFLKKNITTVINSAANVRHYGKYENLYNVNVLSVDNLIKFCGNKISLAHISTLSIAGFKTEKSKEIIFDENTFFINQDFCNNPYLITKFYAEQKLLNSSINVKIFRLGNIMPRVKDGKFQENYNQNAFISAFRLLLKLKKIPKEYLNFKVEFSPVEECAISIIRLLNINKPKKVYHIVNENEIYIKELLSLIDYKNIEIVNTNEFIKSLNNYEEIGSEYIKEYILQNSLNRYSINKTIQILKEEGFKWSVIDSEYINKIIKIIEDNRW